MGRGRTVAAVVVSALALIAIAGFLLGFLPWPTTPSGPGPATPTAPTTGSGLQLQITVAEASVIRGNLQTLTVQVTAAGAPIEGVTLRATVTDASGLQQGLSGVTNEQGVYNFIWIVDPNSSPGTVTVVVVAQKGGYPTGQGTVSFAVSAAGG